MIFVLQLSANSRFVFQTIFPIVKQQKDQSGFSSFYKFNITD